MNYVLQMQHSMCERDSFFVGFGVYVEVGKKFDPEHAIQSFPYYRVCAFHQKLQPRQTVVLRCGQRLVGRYVRVLATSNGPGMIMALCSVQVYGVRGRSGCSITSCFLRVVGHKEHLLPPPPKINRSGCSITSCHISC